MGPLHLPCLHDVPVVYILPFSTIVTNIPNTADGRMTDLCASVVHSVLMGYILDMVGLCPPPYALFWTTWL